MAQSGTEPAVRATSTRKPGAGRRRDPTIDDRLRRAARELYAREGWAGFHFDGVAKAAGVSKDAVYRRYADAQALLLDALSDAGAPVLGEELPVEEALIDYAGELFTYFADGTGYANLRVHIDGPLRPTILQQYRSRVVEPQLTAAVDVLERAQRDGRLHPDADPGAVVTALGGAVMVYALASVAPGYAGAPDGAVMRQLAVFVRQILHGAGADPRPGSRS